MAFFDNIRRPFAPDDEGGTPIAQPNAPATDPQSLAALTQDAQQRAAIVQGLQDQADAKAKGQTQDNAAQAGMLQQAMAQQQATPAVPADVPTIAPSVAGMGALPQPTLNPYDLASAAATAAGNTANVGQAQPSQDAPQRPAGAGLLGTVGKVGGTLLDILKYGPFVAEAHANQAARQAKQAQDTQTGNIAQMRAMAEYRTANRPQTTTVGDQFGTIDQDTGQFTPNYTAQPKPAGAAQIPFGASVDPVTHEVTWAKGVVSPEQAAATVAARDDARQKHSDDMQAANFAHSDAMQARSLEAIKARSSGTGTAAPLPTGTVDYLAQRYITDGSLPSFGMGKASAGMKAAVINRAVEMQSATGQTGADGATNKATFHATATALSGLSRTSANVLASERTRHERRPGAFHNDQGRRHHRNASVQRMAAGRAHRTWWQP